MQSRSHGQFETREAMSLPVLFPLSFKSSLRLRPSRGSAGPEALGRWKAAPPRSICNPDALTSCQKLSRWDIWVLGTVLSESRCGAELRVDAATAAGRFSATHMLLPAAPQSSEKSNQIMSDSGHMTSEDLIHLTENKSPNVWSRHGKATPMGCSRLWSWFFKIKAWFWRWQ